MTPQPFRWDGEAMVPLRPRLADQAFVIGETYALVEHEERSSATHRHYFAVVREAWMNLPEGLAERYPTAEHLRKAALVRAGYRDERSIVCGSKAEARRVAAFIAPMDEYALVTVSEAVVTVYTAKSQSTRAMGREAFAASKEAVLGVLSDMLGVTPEALARAA